MPNTYLYESGERRQNWTLFFVLVFAYLLLVFCAKNVLINDELYFAALSSHLTEQQIEEVVDFNRNWAWVGYFLLPLVLLIKFIVVVSVLAIGYYVFNNRWLFGPFLRTAIIAEFAMLLPIAIKIVWFGSLHTKYNLHDLESFYPLSLMSLIKPAGIDKWLYYPLQIISLFEILYWLILVIGMRQLVGLSWRRATQLVGLSYGPALLLWVLLVMFAIVSTS